MFDLEQAVTAWRREMLAQGIGAPVPLEELESHLRDEIENQVQRGLSAQTAFAAAVAHVGQGRELKREFGRAGLWSHWLAAGWITNTHRILGAAWLIVCSISFAVSMWELISYLRTTGNYQNNFIMFFILTGVLWAVGIFASSRVLRGLGLGVRILNGYAILGLGIVILMACLGQPLSILNCLFAAFYALSLGAFLATAIASRRLVRQ